MGMKTNRPPAPAATEGPVATKLPSHLVATLGALWGEVFLGEAHRLGLVPPAFPAGRVTNTTVASRRGLNRGRRARTTP
jgi:hypothetical protein